MKTQISRFQIHDELTAPEDSLAVLRGALGRGGQLPNLLGVLAGAPAALRGYARFRSELRHGHLELATVERIALAVAALHHAKPSIVRPSALTLDEARAAATWRSADPKEQALLTYLHALQTTGTPPTHVHEAAHEGGWTDEQILEAVAVVALETFTALVHIAGDVPADGSPEQSRRLEAA